MVPKEFPKSLLVVGSGAIGIEFASFYRTLGAEVTGVEVLVRLLHVEEVEIYALAAKAFQKKGMVLNSATTVEKLQKKRERGSPPRAESEGRQNRKPSPWIASSSLSALSATRREHRLGAGRHQSRKRPMSLSTNGARPAHRPEIYAIGDLVGSPWLAHKAMHEGVIVAERIAGVKGLHPLDISKIPGCTYCWPQVASVGLTESKAKEGGRKIKTGKFPFIANGKAVALGEVEGFVKTVFDAETGELLGAHMIGAEVTELIQGYTIARTLEATDAELQASVFPHPTLSEMMHEAVLAADGRPLHI